MQTAQKARWRDNEIIVRFRQNVSSSDIDALLQANGAQRTAKLRGQSGMERLRLVAGSDPEAVAANLRTSPLVNLAEPNYLITADQTIPDDPRYSEQRALKNTGQTSGYFGSDINRLPQNANRVQLWQRYEKKVPGHHIQIDVKFLNFTDGSGKRVRRYQYTAIDDASALKIYERHNQANAIDFVNYFVEKFPFRIHTIRTDHGHEFQAKFHWHVEDLGINHTYIRVRTPRLNGKVERSHGIDQQEFYQLLTYTDDVDLNEKLGEWESFYNYFCPHRSLKGKTPYEVLRDKLQSSINQPRL